MNEKPCTSKDEAVRSICNLSAELPHSYYYRLRKLHDWAESVDERQPKLYFDNHKELLGSLDEWKARLGLSDWTIAARICKREDMKLDDCAGESEVHHVTKCGLISILKRDEIPNDMIVKQPMEMTLIHELLHFKFVSIGDDSYASAYHELMQHQLLQELAKALYMAKYNLDISWFTSEQFIHEKGEYDV